MLGTAVEERSDSCGAFCFEGFAASQAWAIKHARVAGPIRRGNDLETWVLVKAAQVFQTYGDGDNHHRKVCGDIEHSGVRT